MRLGDYIAGNVLQMENEQKKMKVSESKTKCMNSRTLEMVSKCKIFLLILTSLNHLRVVVLGWREDKTLDHFPFQYLTKFTVHMEWLLDIIPLPHQILPSPCS